MKFIGIDVHLRSTVTSVIDEDLNIIEIENLSFEETIDKVLEHKAQMVSIDAPSGLNTGLMNDENYRVAIGRKINGHYNKKVSEYELSRRGINPFPTPDSIEKVRGRNDLSWMEKGLWLYEVLKEKGYILLNQNNYMNNKERGLVEVFPHASFSVLAGQLPLNKNTEEGLNQRYLLLRNVGINNLEGVLRTAKKKDKDDFLDSIAAAYTGYLIYKDLGSFVGDDLEGQIGLPDKVIKDSYKRVRKEEKLSDSKLDKVAVNEKFLLSNNAVLIQNDKEVYEYEFLHNDSVLWLKYFKPIDSPKIDEIFNINEDFSVCVTITNTEGISVDVKLIKMKGNTKGLKIAEEYKSDLKQFWGSHGDYKTYKIIIRK